MSARAPAATPSIGVVSREDGLVILALNPGQDEDVVIRMPPSIARDLGRRLLEAAAKT
jgi:hypothetical protein